MERSPPINVLVPLEMMETVRCPGVWPNDSTAVTPGRTSVSPSTKSTTSASNKGSIICLAAGAISESQVRLTWQDNATGEVAYEIEGKAGGAFSLFQTVGANAEITQPWR